MSFGGSAKIRRASWLVVLAAAAGGCAFDPGASPRIEGTDGAVAIDAAVADAAQSAIDARPPADAPGIDAAAPDADPGPDGEPAAACLTDPAYVANEATGIRYRAVPTLTSWNDAQADCASADAHLAVIDSASENAYVDSLIVGPEIWIGLSDQAVEGTFVWVTGTPVVFTNWRPDGNPNNGSGTEPQDCAEIDETGGQWNDDNCPELDAYVCECPV